MKGSIEIIDVSLSGNETSIAARDHEGVALDE